MADSKPVAGAPGTTEETEDKSKVDPKKVVAADGGSDDSGADSEGGAGGEGEGAKKKKRKKKKKGGGGGSAGNAAALAVVQGGPPMKQTARDPMVPVALLYSGGMHGAPEQEVMPHPYDPSTLHAIRVLNEAAPILGSKKIDVPESVETASKVATAATTVSTVTSAIASTNTAPSAVLPPHVAAQPTPTDLTFPSLSSEACKVPEPSGGAAAAAALAAATTTAIPSWRRDAARVKRDADGRLFGVGGKGGVPSSIPDGAGSSVKLASEGAPGTGSEVSFEERVKKLRLAAEVHREVRYWAQSIARPGMRYIDVCDGIEERVRRLCGLSPVVLWGAGAPGLGNGGFEETDSRTPQGGKGGRGGKGGAVAASAAAGFASKDQLQGLTVGVDVLSNRAPGTSMTSSAYNLSSLYPDVFPANSPMGVYSGTSNLPCGNGFPTGCSVNHVAAHDTPNLWDESMNRTIGYSDLTKWDFGVHIDGEIIDSAWTSCFDPRFDGLKEAVLDATNTGIAAAGADVRLCDIGAAIQEAMESYEVCLGEKAAGVGSDYTYGGSGMSAGGAGKASDIKQDDRARSYVQVKCVSNLCGHTIGRGLIHFGKSVPIVRGGSTERLEEGDVLAIETFGTTGSGSVREDGIVSHYMVADGKFDKWRGGAPAAGAAAAPGRTTLTAPQLAKVVQREFGSLPFARKWVQQRDVAALVLSQVGSTATPLEFAKAAARVTQAQVPSHFAALQSLVMGGHLSAHPPLLDKAGSYVAQFEHTLVLRPTCKEILSRGIDY